MAWLDEPLRPDPVIEAIKKDIDRSQLRANLALTPDERVRKMVEFAKFLEDLKRKNPAETD